MAAMAFLRAWLLVLCLQAPVSSLTRASDATQSSRVLLPKSFRPPAVFRNEDLLRTIALDKGYVKESVTVKIENVDESSQDEYYVPLEADVIGHVGGFEAHDKAKPDQPALHSEVVEYDSRSATQYYRIKLAPALGPKDTMTLNIKFNVLSALQPLPATIAQDDKQYLQLRFSTHAPSAYVTTVQKTKVKLPTHDAPEVTGNPEQKGALLTYGPYKNIPAGAVEPATVRYEFTKALVHVSLLERDIEVSHWGGNIAFEERYRLTNRGANLSKQFSRFKWAQHLYYKPPTVALSQWTHPLPVGSADAYFVDEIGNISTSHFRAGLREATLELKPRYPVFGGWNFPFKIGWNNNLANFLRRVDGGHSYVLKVPILEGPKINEGVAYEKVRVRVILPEGARNVQWHTTLPLVETSETAHRTFMDTVGRTALTLTAVNVIDEARDTPLIITYDYPMLAGLRKPLTIIAGLMGVFVTAYVIGNVDVSIGRKI